MDDSAKYLIHARITADGIVERTDIVGAVFGQTEGLLGEDLDIRGLQDSEKLGRIDVEVESESGQSFGQLTIGSNLEKAETAILAAALETIERVGPCRARLEVTGIEDVRAAKRRRVVDRAKELLSEGFEESQLSSSEVVDEVRDSVRVADVAEYEGLPAGPRVADGDAIVVVEGRADVRRLLEFGIKNAVAVEGTNVPSAVAELSRDRTTTAFLDGDRGGDLILRELAQVADVDHVARAPAGESVEDLSREAVTSALRGKTPLGVALEGLAADSGPGVGAAVTDGSTPVAVDATDTPDTPGETGEESPPEPGEASRPDSNPDAGSDPDRDGDRGPEPGVRAVGGEGRSPAGDAGAPAAAGESGGDESGGGVTASTGDEPGNLPGHAEAVVGGGAGVVRLLNEEYGTLAEAPAGDAFETLEDADPAPHAVVLDGVVEQRLLDVAAQRGVREVAARERGQFTKQPADVRVRTLAEFRAS